MFSKNAPNRTETRLGLMILLVLVVIGAGVFYRQFDFNPAVTALQNPGSESVGPGGKIPDSLLPLPEDFAPMTPSESFAPHTLFEKINGQADLYLSSGFVQLKTQRFVSKADPASWLELFVYDMGSGLNAFSVYSQQYRQGADPADLSDYAYHVDSALFLAHGPFYVEMITSTASASLKHATRFLADAFLKKHPLDRTEQSEEDQIQGLAWFPSKGLDQESLRMILTNAFGFDGLDNVFVADYRLNDIMVTAFVSRRRNVAEAAERAHAFHDFLLMFDGKDVDTDLSIKDVRLVEIMGTYEVIFSQGVFVAGVHEAPDEETAQSLALELDRKLKEFDNAP